MDADRLAELLRSFSTTPSRREVMRVLSGLSVTGLLAGLTPVSSDARHHHKKHKHRKQTSPPEVVCPATCPVCQMCNAGTGGCEVRTDGNGLPGQNCQTPRVCCSGECCDPIHTCGPAGACATCAEVCGATCAGCLNLADGTTQCHAGLRCVVTSNCTSNADCPAGMVCAISSTDRATNTTGSGCGTGGAKCFGAIPCP